MKLFLHVQYLTDINHHVVNDGFTVRVNVLEWTARLACITKTRDASCGDGSVGRVLAN